MGCTVKPLPLNAKLLPKTMEAVRNFRCAGCVDASSKTYKCRACKMAKAAESFKSADIIAFERKPKTKTLLCRECVLLGRTAQDQNLYHCCKCDTHLGRAKFSKTDMNHFQQRSGKSLQCTNCKRSAAISDKR